MFLRVAGSLLVAASTLLSVGLHAGLPQPPPRRPALPAPASLAVTETARAEPAPGIVDTSTAALTFTLRSINTDEQLVVHLDPHTLRPHEDDRDAAAQLFRCRRTGEVVPIDPRLLTQLYRIARQLDRPLELVSGHRAASKATDHNFHVQGLAADVRVPTLKSWDLRRVAEQVGVPGLGTYPGSGMIHVDVRDKPYRWVDWSRPKGGR